MSNPKKGYTLRKFVLDIHLWLGVGSGLVLFVVCLTGTIYTFRNEIVEAVEADHYQVATSAGQVALPATTLIARLERAHPDSKAVSLSVPEDPQRAWSITLTKRAALQRQMAEESADRQSTAGGEGRRAGGKGRHARGEEPGRNKASQEGRGEKGKGGRKGHGNRDDSRTYLVNQYTGAVQGDVNTALSKFFFTVMGLHRWLLVEGGVGQIITGIATLIFLVLELTGLALWAPAKLKQWRKWKMWKQGFSIKTDGNWKRINHDLHNTLGFYTFLLVSVMALTGLCWSFEWYRDGLSRVMGAKVFGARGEKPLPSAVPATPGRTLSADDFLALANRQLTYPGNVRLTLPRGTEGSASVQKNKTGFFALAAADKLMFDQYTGQVLKREIFAEKPLNEQIVGLIRPLHMGDVFGTFTKIIYFIACLIATSLPVTGVIIWLNKINKKPREKTPVPPAEQLPKTAGATRPRAVIRRPGVPVPAAVHNAVNPAP